MSSTSEKLRVLGRLRLSRSTEESTSIDRQRETIQQWADAHGHTVVGWAEDVDVSGSIDPFETPQLGPWLNDRPHEWDVLAAWKLDRLGRNAIQLSKLFGWVMDHDKTLVSCSESIDLSSWAGRMLANVIAGLAEGELEAIRERQRGSRHKLRNSARWGGGKPPFGYVAVKNPQGEGWALEVDPVASKLIRRIVDDTIAGKPSTQIAAELNREGVLTPSQYHRARSAGYPTLLRSELPADLDVTPKQEPGKVRRRKVRTENPWTQTPIRNMLRSDAIRGYVHHKGEVVRDDDGMPIQLAEPLVTLDEWELIQSTLDRRRDTNRAKRRVQLSPLAGVAVCLVCGYTLHHTRKVARGIEYRYYRCENKDTSDIRADFLEDLVGELVVDEIGDVEILERVWVPGDSRETELREAIAAVDDLVRVLGNATSSTVRDRIQRQISALDAKIAELEATPARESRWEYKPTGGIYRDVWESSDPEGRRELLRRSGITVAVSLTGIDGKRSGDNSGTFEYRVDFPTELMANLGHPKDGEQPWKKISGSFIPVFERRSAADIVRTEATPSRDGA
ncbi:recombinase family protein [Nocardia cyriacigeorgica]|uniref:Recombinase family protein n=1 Tax=Nocardia cyriacigeorgica TaxID=135487 RepID=A0A5R8NZG1_9NOCA|nr:recombinase family protein [Nocardia cyriacigeorgica]TLF82329.1 recombinase family protein [Nocardia cyriacigeorgica]